MIANGLQVKDNMQSLSRISQENNSSLAVGIKNIDLQLSMSRLAIPIDQWHSLSKNPDKQVYRNM
jgi:hypothetical protein